MFEGTLQEAEARLREERDNSGIFPGCSSIGCLHEVCLTCAMVGIGMRHAVPLMNLFENQDEMNVVEEE